MQEPRISVFLAFFIVTLVFSSYAQDLDTIKIYYLSGDYKSAITEGERVLSRVRNSDNLDELYYILGLSYLKDGNYLRASDIFEIILSEFRQSRYKEDAKLGLGDVSYMRGDLDKAQAIYEDVLDDNPHTKLRAKIYYRLRSVAFKKGDTEKGRIYSQKLASGFPSSSETAAADEVFQGTPKQAEFFYTVQVGSFTHSRNAHNLRSILEKRGYPAFVEEGLSAKNAKAYKVKVGRLGTRKEALDLEKNLTREGYPTKVVP
jgi:tetratricopeptide (TPR) repeat protein